MKKWICISGILLSGQVMAAPTEVTHASAQHMGGDAYHFSVTLKHPDTGWKHYANKWQVQAEDGEVLGVRVLQHPHVEEQPFTRALSGLKIAEDINRVFIVAGCTHDGINSNRFLVSLDK